MTTYRAYADEAYIEKNQLEEIRTMMDSADHIVRHLNHIDSATKTDLKDFINQLEGRGVEGLKELDEKIEHYEDMADCGATLVVE